MTISSWKQGVFEISTDISRLNKEWLFDSLHETYWAADDTSEKLWTSIENARNYGLYNEAGAQVGFTRVVTDMARFAWVSDVLIDPAARGLGLGKWLMQTITADPALATVHLWMLGTDDAHGLYEQYGFEKTAASAMAGQFMHLRRAKI